jgi:hypothetical protein
MSVPQKALDQLKAAEEKLALAKQESNPVTETTEIVHDEEQPGQTEQVEVTLPQNNEALLKELELERQRTASLKGRIDSQLSNANAKNKELQAQLDELSGKFKELEVANTEPGYKSKLTEQEIEEVGEEVLELQTRVIKGTLEEELSKGSLNEIINDLVQKKVNERVTKDKESSKLSSEYWRKVEAIYPDARSINQSDQQWFLFLERFDPMSGKKYRDVGTEAIQSGDVATLVDLLRLYKPIDQTVPTISAMPERSGNTIIKEAEGPPAFKKSVVKQFYDDVSRGKFKGTATERKELEDKIMEAAQAGRIV